MNLVEKGKGSNGEWLKKGKAVENRLSISSYYLMPCTYRGWVRDRRATMSSRDDALAVVDGAAAEVGPVVSSDRHLPRVRICRH